MNIISIVPPRLGGLDMLLPLFMEIKNRYPSCSIHLVYVDCLAYHQLKKDEFLWNEVIRLVDRLTILKHGCKEFKKNGLFAILDKIKFASRLVNLLVAILFYSQPILMHSQSLNSRLVRLMHSFVQFGRGLTLGHRAGLVFDPLDKGLTADEIRKKYGDAFICFKSQDTSTWKEKDRNTVISIGYTRLYKSWCEKLLEVSNNVVDKQLKKLEMNTNSSIIVVYLPSTVEGVFGLSELDEWLRSLVKCTRNIYPESLVLLKPHPMQNIVHVNEILSHIEDSKIGISYLHPGILAACSKLVISHHSSTIIDALALGVPTIQYQKFTTHWIKRHPEGSIFLKLQPIWTQDENELEIALSNIKRGNWVAPNLAEIMEHEESVGNLFNRLDSLNGFKT